MKRSKRFFFHLNSTQSNQQTIKSRPPAEGEEFVVRQTVRKMTEKPTVALAGKLISLDNLPLRDRPPTNEKRTVRLRLHSADMGAGTCASEMALYGSGETVHAFDNSWALGAWGGGLSSQHRLSDASIRWRSRGIGHGRLLGSQTVDLNQRSKSKYRGRDDPRPGRVPSRHEVLQANAGNAGVRCDRGRTGAGSCCAANAVGRVWAGSLVCTKTAMRATGEQGQYRNRTKRLSTFRPPTTPLFMYGFHPCSSSDFLRASSIFFQSVRPCLHSFHAFLVA
jgi:hypothetical protein